MYPVYTITRDELMLSQVIQNAFGFRVKYSSAISVVSILNTVQKYTIRILSLPSYYAAYEEKINFLIIEYLRRCEES